MSFFSKIFNRNGNLKDPDIQFGRYTDSYKEEEKYKNWDKAIEYFDNEKYILFNNRHQYFNAVIFAILKK